MFVYSIRLFLFVQRYPAPSLLFVDLDTSIENLIYCKCKDLWTLSSTPWFIIGSQSTVCGQIGLSPFIANNVLLNTAIPSQSRLLLHYDDRVKKLQQSSHVSSIYYVSLYNKFFSFHHITIIINFYNIPYTHLDFNKISSYISLLFQVSGNSCLLLVSLAKNLLALCSFSTFLYCKLRNLRPFLKLVLLQVWCFSVNSFLTYQVKQHLSVTC